MLQLSIYGVDLLLLTQEYHLGELYIFQYISEFVAATLDLSCDFTRLKPYLGTRI